MKISSGLSRKIKAYSAMGGALAALDASATVVYTDVSPDYNGGADSTYFLDLNNDGTTDFAISAYNSSGYNVLYLTPGTSNAVLGITSSLTIYGNTFYIPFPYALNSGATIGPGAAGSWLSYNSSYYAYLNIQGQFGNWSNATDKFLGLRIQVGGNTYYGWCRMTVDQTGSAWVIKDYAYENVAGTAITAGDMGAVVARGASDIIATDIGNALNGTDLQVSFDKASDESTVSEYRIMTVKSTNAAAFDLAAAQAVTTGDYLAVTPNGSAGYQQAYTATGTDVDGDAITVGQPYKIFVLSVADGTNATVDTLAGPSAEITLINNIGLSESGLKNIELYSFENTLVVNLQNMETGNAELKLINMAGRVVYDQHLQTGSRYDLVLDQLSSGMYLTSLVIDGKTVNRKVMIGKL